MNYIESAIKEAVEKGGMEKPLGQYTSFVMQQLTLMRPAFWQAYAKARGEIDANWPNGEMRCENKLGRCEERYCEYGGYRNPYDRWHRFIDHLAEGLSVDSFFAGL